MAKTTLDQMYADFLNSPMASPQAKELLDAYIDARVHLILLSTVYNGAQLIRLGSVKDGVSQEDNFHA